jgi:hypothetical protein
VFICFGAFKEEAIPHLSLYLKKKVFLSFSRFFFLRRTKSKKLLVDQRKWKKREEDTLV